MKDKPAMRRLGVLVLIGVTCAATASAAPQAGPYAPRVFVFTVEPKATSPTEEEQGRLDSVRDVREALGRKAGIVLVPTADEAQVLVEVVAREERDAPVGGFGGTVLKRPIETILRLHLKIGEHEIDVKGIGKGYWSRAAKDAADRAMRWIARTFEASGRR
jgi:hypothetical protein